MITSGPAPVANVNLPEFWEDLYRRHGDGWELHEPSPPLVDWLRDHGAPVPLAPSARRTVAVPGCGRGHDARLLAAAGFDVCAFDFAHDAIREARALDAGDGTRVRFEQRDVFTIGGEYRHAFDGVWEYTCFCAIDPGRRAEYIRAMGQILRPGGWFLACFYPIREGGSGPPFPVSRDEVRRLLASGFRIEREWTPARSAPRRIGEEWMVLARPTDTSA